MKITIKGNKGFDIGGDLIKVDVPHNVEVDISDNEGTRIGGHNVNLNVSVNSDSLASFVADASMHFHELSTEQQQIFTEAIKALRVDDKKGNHVAVKWLYDLAVSIPGGAITSVILRFLGVSS